MALAKPEPWVLVLHSLAKMFPAFEAKAVVVARRLALPDHIKPVGSDIAPDLVFDFV